MTFAVGSIGSAGHLSTELLKRAGGIDFSSSLTRGLRRLPGRSARQIAASSTRSWARCSTTRASFCASWRSRHRPARTNPGRADGGRDHPWLRVIQLVRTLGSGQSCRPTWTQRLNAEVNQGAGDRHERQAHAAGYAADAGLGRRLREFQRDDMARAQKIIKKANSVSNEAGAAHGDWPAVSASAPPDRVRLLADGWDVIGVDVAPPVVSIPAQCRRRGPDGP